MRLLPLLFTATLLASPAAAQQPASTTPDGTKDQGTRDQATGDQGPASPVSIAKIRGALETTPSASPLSLDEAPTFRIQIKERQRIEELLATLNFKAGVVPAGGVYMAEQNRIMFPSVDNPTRQPLGAFSESELLTIAAENVLGKYVASPILHAISKAERAHAENQAKDEVRSAIAQFCEAQPNAGAGIAICDTSGR